MNTKTKEAIRYLGYGKHTVDEPTLARISEGFHKLEAAASMKSVYRIFELSFEEKDGHADTLNIGNLKVESKNLGKNLKGCREVIVFGATLGTGVDMLIKKCSLMDMAEAVVIQACAAALLEEYADECQKEIERKLKEENRYIRPRFSPGYGDFKIEHQERLLAMIEAPKKIGLTVTDSMMLTPTKSITAVMGVSDQQEPCHIKGCEVCKKTDCLYRRS